MRKVRKSRFNKGFSMAEVLIVVAIIGILLAVAIPNVLGYYRTLKLTELDDSARTIFLAAQNRITALKNQGVELKTLGSESGTAMAGKSASVNFWFIGTDDIGATPGGSSSEGMLRTLLPGGSIDTQLQNNHYVVEFDPTTGAVYAVWYWENGKFDYGDDAYKTPGVQDPSNKESRLPYMVGYYGGTSIDRATVNQMPIPEVNITNAEELRVDISIPSITGAVDNNVKVSVLVDGIEIIPSTTLWPVTGHGKVVLDTLKTDYSYEPKTYGGSATDWIAGSRYKSWKSKYGLISEPGEDITVTVVASYEGDIDGQYLIPQSVSATVNSLFESIEETATGSGKYTANIAYGRHLQNLHDGSSVEFASDIGDFITAAKQTRDIDFIEPAPAGTDPIYSWLDTYPKDKDSLNPYKRAREFHALSNGNISVFDGGGKEIRNMVAVGEAGQAGLFQVVYYPKTFKNINIVNPQIHGEEEGTSPVCAGGIVGSAYEDIVFDNCAVYSDIDFSDLTLDDLETEGPGQNNEIKLGNSPHIGAPMENSQTGGFVGCATKNVTIKNSNVSMIIIGANQTGGFVGVVDGVVEIENSYSGSYIYGNRWVGGLVGNAHGDVIIKNSYAAGVINNGYNDGFVGAGLFLPLHPNYSIYNTNTYKVEDSYAAVYYDTVKGTTFNDDTNTTEYVAGTIYGLFPGASSATFTNVNVTNSFYVKQNDISSRYDADSGEAITSAELAEKVKDGFATGGVWYVNASGENDTGYTFPFHEISETAELADPYPYPMLEGGDTYPVPHYGDWLENKANGSLVNWEQYSTTGADPDYRFWGYIGGDSGVEKINNLMKGDTDDSDLEYAIADGYGVLVKQEGGSSTEPTVTINGSTVTFSPADTVIGAYTDPTDGAKYDLYKITVSTSAPADYYTAVDVNGTSFWYNPDFACEVILNDADAAAAPAEPKSKTGAAGYGDTGSTSGVVIRTARQLANMPVYTNDTTMGTTARGWSYTQLLDIDYGKYTGDDLGGRGSETTRQTPATLQGTGVSGSTTGYYGNNFEIRHLYIGNNSGYAGLFGSITYEVELSNIQLVNVNVTAIDTAYVGGLVGKVESNCIINNCGIYVEDEDDPADNIDDEYGDFCIIGSNVATGNNFTGGLIGQLFNGTAERCFASVRVSGGYATGGFAGQIYSGMITDCYSGGHTSGGAYEFDLVNNEANVTGKCYVGGFVGNVSTPSFDGVCYSTCSVCNSANTMKPGLFCGLGSISGGASVYATGAAFTSSGGSATVINETYLKTGASIPARRSTSFKTAPYDVALFEKVVGTTDPDYTKPMSYPYDSNLDEHHGDWVTFPMVANIEKYGTDDYGVYAASVASDGITVSATINTLKSQSELGDAGVVVNDYYRVISAHELTGAALNFTIDSDSTSYILEADNTNFTDGKITDVNGTDYFVYNFFVTGAIDSAASVTNYYHTIKLGNSTFLFNSHFGLEAFDVTAKVPTNLEVMLEKPGAAGKDADGNVVQFQDIMGNDTDTATDVVIRSARQLANIQKYTNDTAGVGTAAQGWTYDQLLNVDFAKWETALKGKEATNTLDPAALNGGSYYGHKDTNKIQNLYIGGTDSVGLFGTVSGGSRIDGVRLVDVNVTGGTNTGALVGTLDGGNVSDCGVYVSGKSYADFYNKFTVTGSGDVGGLIGTMTGGEVSKSFAAVEVSSGAATGDVNAGGFAGQILGGSVESCYAGGYVDETSQTYSKDSVNVSFTGTTTGTVNVGGFAGNVGTDASFSGTNYSTASVGGGTSMGLFAGAGSVNTPGVGDVFYAHAMAFDAVTGGAVVSARDESDYLVSPVEQHVKLSKDNTHKYNAKDDEYPYQTELTEHYGDWIGLVMGSYYDDVDNGMGIGWYSNGGDTANGGFSTLNRGNPTSNTVANDDGYAFLSVNDLGDSLAMIYNGVGYILTKDTTVTAEIDGVTYNVYMVPAEALNIMSSETYYSLVSVNGQFFTANFAFAGEIFDGKTEAAALNTVRNKINFPYMKGNGTTVTNETLDTSGVVIRSARQLANLGILTNNDTTSGKMLQGLTYDQLIDINYDKYGDAKMPAVGTDGTYNHQPITLEKGTYNGHEFAIRGLKPGFTVLSGDTIAASGLFSRAKDATLNDIRIVNSTFTATMAVSGSGTPTPGGGGGTTPGGGGGTTPGVGTVSGLKLITTAGNGSSNKAVYFNVARLKDPSEWPAGNGQILYESTDSSASENDGFFGIVYTRNSENTYPQIKEETYQPSGQSKVTHRLRLNSRIDSDFIEFATSGPAKIQIWWMQEAKERQILIQDATGTTVSQTNRNPSTFSKTNYFDELTVSSAGVYHIGGSNGANWIYRIVIQVTSDEVSTGTVAFSGGLPISTGTGGAVAVPNDYKIRVGALAGVLDGATVKNCGVYVKGDSSTSADEAYNTYVVENTVTGSEDLVGGFAGNITQSSVTTSFASVKVTGVKVAGGFAGKLTSGTTAPVTATTIDNCYVGGHTYQGTFFAKPEADETEGKGMVNVKATASGANGVTVASGGFAGIVENSVTFEGTNYSTASFGVGGVYMGVTKETAESTSSHSNADLEFTKDTTEMGQFIGKTMADSSLDTLDAQIYALGEAFVADQYVGLYATTKGNGYEKKENTDDEFEFKTYDSSAKDSDKKDVPYINHNADYLDETVVLQNAKSNEEKTTRYDLELGNNFPYELAGDQKHYGDWTNRYDLIYYEVYDITEKDENGIDVFDPATLTQIDLNGDGDDEYVGFYAVLKGANSSENIVVNTLSLTGHVIDSGYMVMSERKVDTLKFTIHSTYAAKNAEGLATLLTPLKKQISLQGYALDDTTGQRVGGGGTTLDRYVYPIPFAAINLAPSDTYYQDVTINGQPYMLNQHFACEAINVDLLDSTGKNLDLTTIRSKPGLVYNEYVRNNQNVITKTTQVTLTNAEHYVIIRSPWNLAGMARYTRDGNESIYRSDARTWTYLQTMDIDYSMYNGKQIFDGNTNNRSESARSMWFAGTNFPYGQAPAILEGGGKFDGTGHMIANLYVSSDSGNRPYVGLFGRISGNMTTVQNVYMKDYHVNAWKGPDSGIYVGGIVGEIDGGAILQRVSVTGLEMDFHSVPAYNEDGTTKDTMFKTSGTVKFNAVGGAVGRVVNGTVDKVYVNGLSVDFDSGKYSYKWTSVKAYNSKGELKDDYYINEQLENNSDGTKYGSSAKVDNYEKEKTEEEYNAKNCVNVSIGGAIGEINTNGASVNVKTDGSVCYASITDVYVVDPTIKANKGQQNRVGGLVGSADGGDFASVASFDPATGRIITIENSGVYMKDKIAEYDNYGVISTYEQATTSGSDPKKIGPDVDKNIDMVGGFIGRADPFVRISNSFAAVKVSGLSEVGGFAGHIEGAEIDNCFAGGHTVNKSYPGTPNVTATNATGFAGGFVGDIEGKDSVLRFYGTDYTTCSVGGDGSTGAFVGRAPAGDTDRTDAMKTVFSKATSEGKPVTLYATGYAVPVGTAKEVWDESGYGLLTGADLPTGSADAKNRYDTSLPETYPYANNTKVNTDGDADTSAVKAHYGDWIEHEFAGAFYYENEGGVYNFYIIKGDLAFNQFSNPESTLCTKRDGVEITEWGYGYFAPDGVTVATPSTMNEPTGELQTAVTEKFGTGMKVMVMKGAAVATAPDAQEWTFTKDSDSITFYVNTAYAAAIEGKSGAAAVLGTAAETPYQIRTVEQLDNIEVSDGVYFRQTHDISGKDYGTKFTPNELTNGVYDGQSYRILDLNIEPTAGDSAALFSALENSSISNTILYSTKGDSKITGAKAAGIAVSMTGGSITNSIVAGYTVSGQTIGGLVAETNGGVTISNSEATVSRSITEAGGNIGGLVGYVASGTLDVTESYAGGEVVTASGEKLDSGTTSMGGIVGAKNTTSGSTAKVEYDTVYSYVAMAEDDIEFDKTFKTVKDDNGKDVETSDYKYVTFYGIGPDVDTTRTDSIGYWSGGVLDPNTDDRALGTALVKLEKWSSKHKAAQVYMPNAGSHVSGATALTDIVTDYPFIYGAFVKDVDGELIHYGDWPVAESYAGLFNWEQEKVTKIVDGAEVSTYEYHFYAYGVELVRGRFFESVLLDDLCKDHHVNERATILKSGYGYFLPNSGTFDFDVLDGANSKLSDFKFREKVTSDNMVQQTTIEKIESNIFDDENLGVAAGEYNLYVLFDENNADMIDQRANVKGLKWQITENQTGNYETFGMTVYPTFGEAIYGDDLDLDEGGDKNNEGSEPMQVRTRQQFERLKANAKDKSIDYIVLSHDIDFAETEADGYRAHVDGSAVVDSSSNYVPGQLRTKIFDGQGYRLFDVVIKVNQKEIYTEEDVTKPAADPADPPTVVGQIIDQYNNPEGDAALFLNNRDSEKTTIKHLILYSPGNKGQIETTVDGGYAAGIVAREVLKYKTSKKAGEITEVSSQYTFENCIVAGYTIKGSGAVGGIIGVATQKGGMDNCQVVAEFVGTKDGVFIGGLAGKWNTDIKNCYTGGSIKLDGVTTPTDATVIGGIVGSMTDKKYIRDSYTYMDFTALAATNAKVNIFGGGKTRVAESSSYLNGDNVKDVTFDTTDSDLVKENNGEPKKYAEMPKATTATYSYWPGSTDDGVHGYVANESGTYPFTSVVKAGFKEDGKDVYVHYGVWPEGAQAAGVAYYEKYADNTYGFQIVGLDDKGNPLAIDSTLCTDRHTEADGTIKEHRIVETGYAAFTTKARNLTVGTDNTLDGLTPDDTNKDEVKTKLSSVLASGIEVINVYPTGKVGNVSDHSVEVTVSGTTAKATVHYTMGFAEVAEDQFGTVANPYVIRTVRQLDNIPDGVMNKYFEQSHDLYGTDKDGRKYSEINGGQYTGAMSFSGTYDGQYYRILELSISGNSKFGVGLFSSAQNASISNIIMYSPSRTAEITSTDNSEPSDPASPYNYSGTGGIVGRSNDVELKVTNCIVAGYTISGKRVVGGIVGYSYWGGTIENCAAVNTLVGNVDSDQAIAVGGITGAGDADKTSFEYSLSINNCYAGGSITGAGPDTKVGGLIGGDLSGKTEPTVKDSYSYVDLSDTGADAANVYAIGNNLTSDSTGNYFLSENAVRANKDHGTGVDYFEMCEITGDGKGAAVYAYVPNGDGTGLTSKSYPFPAVVKDENNNLVHYGVMPEHKPVEQAMTGIFYWDLHGSEYEVQYIGKNEKNEVINGGKLCEARDGAGISESGFGYFYLGSSATASTVNAGDEVDGAVLEGITKALTDNDVFNKVKVKAFKQGTDTSDQTWTVGEVSAHVKQGSWGVRGTALGNTKVEIRSYSELALLNKYTAESMDIKLVHDIDAEASKDTSNPDSKYTPATLTKNSTFDGQGYRILELSIEGSGSGNVGLFAENSGTVTIQNVVLYSPSGTATISGGNNVGGIIGNAGKYNITITNCVVSGYTISGSKYVGGIAGYIEGNGGSDIVEKCEAVNILKGESGATGVGGITGYSKRQIVNCYAGGTIEASGSTKIGGINGEANSDSVPKISNSYSFVYLNHPTKTNAYVISGPKNGGNSSSLQDKDNCYYLLDTANGADKLKKNGSFTGLSIAELTSQTITNFGKANTTYAPTTSSLDGSVSGVTAVAGQGMTAMDDKTFPFPAIFKVTVGGAETYEHYGTWVEAATTSGDPGIPEGPSFEAAILPDKFILPEIEENESQGGDGHTEYVRLRSYVARVHLSRG